MSKCNGPWYTFGKHKWTFSSDEEYRTAQRIARPYCFIMGTFEAREIRTCSRCQRVEQRDVYGGNYIPYGWTLRRYAP